jgi:hypothetical protein
LEEICRPLRNARMYPSALPAQIQIFRYVSVDGPGNQVCCLNEKNRDVQHKSPCRSMGAKAHTYHYGESRLSEVYEHGVARPQGWHTPEYLQGLQESHTSERA